MDKKIIFLMIIISVILLAAISFLFYNIVAGHPKDEGQSANLRAPANSEGSAMLSKVQKFVKSGDDESAVKASEELIVKYPDSPQAESAYFLLVSIYEKRGDLLKAKEVCQKMIEQFPGSNNIIRAEELADDLNIKILFSPVITQGFTVYEVQKGDTLTKIAKKFDTTVEFIIRANSLKDNNIRVGKKVKLPKTKFSIVVDKSQNILTLKSDGEIVKTYRVSTGKDSCTPVGTYKIANKIIDPPWYPPTGGVIPAHDPKNVLGSRWLGLSKPSYGIHGTIEPQSIGKSVTEGCVRMRNSDVEELYALVPEGTEVVIVD